MYSWPAAVRRETPLYAAALAVLCLTAPSPALAQFDLYITQDRTLTNSQWENIYVGIDQNQKPYPNLDVAFDGPNVRVNNLLSVRHGGHVSVQQGYVNGAELRETSGLLLIDYADHVDAYDQSAASIDGIGANTVFAHDNATVDANGGDIFTLQATDNGVVNLTNARVDGLFGSGNGILNLNTDRVWAITMLNLFDSSTLNFGKGDQQQATVFDSANLNVTGGTLHQIDAGGGNVSVSGGVVGDISVSGGGFLSVSAGAVDSITGQPYSLLFLTLTGGSVGVVDATNSDYSAVTIRGGDIGALTQSSGYLETFGGTVTDLTLTGMNGSISQIAHLNSGEISHMTAGGFYESDMSGGQIGDLTLNDNATFALYGGYIGEVTLNNNAIFSVYGGSVGGQTIGLLSSAASVNVYGKNVAFGTTPSAGQFHGIDGLFWSLGGTLQNGDLLDTLYFVPGAPTDAPTGLTIINTGVAAPEPGTLALITLGVLLGAAHFRKRQ